MRPIIGCALFGWLLLGTWCAPAIADGGAVRVSVTEGGYRITVFTAPTPLRAGPVDISVLVQDAATGEPLPGLRVTVRMTKAGSPAREYPATTAAATNKLFLAALFDLLEPGRWDMQVRVEGPHGTAVIDGELEAAEPLPRWPDIWPWVGWPALVIALFGIHQWFVHRRAAFSKLVVQRWPRASAAGIFSKRGTRASGRTGDTIVKS